MSTVGEFGAFQNNNSTDGYTIFSYSRMSCEHVVPALLSIYRGKEQTHSLRLRYGRVWNGDGDTSLEGRHHNPTTM